MTDEDVIEEAWKKQAAYMRVSVSEAKAIAALEAMRSSVEACMNITPDYYLVPKGWMMGLAHLHGIKLIRRADDVYEFNACIKAILP